MVKTVNPLARYLDEHGVSQGEFGRRIGAARGVVSRWCRGRRVPDLHFALVIARETEGAVPVAAWEEQADPERKRRLAGRRSVRRVSRRAPQKPSHHPA